MAGDVRELNCSLREIQDSVQHVVSAIAAVLDVDVAVITDDFKLLATSRTFKETRGTDINEKFIKEVYRKGFAVIPNPGEHEFCEGCRLFGKCPETAEVVWVIESEGIRYGVMLLVAYTNGQKEKLLNNTREILDFISEMTKLIKNELLLQESLTKETLLARQFATTLDFINSGIINIDKNGIITHINQQAQSLLGMKCQQTSNCQIHEYLPEILVRQILEGNVSLKNCEVKTISPRNLHCLLDANPITVKGQMMGAIIHLSAFTDFCSAVYKFSAYHVSTTFDDILGESEQILEVKKKALNVAAGDSTVLITGESGTGKELFSRAIHTFSSRKDKPFIAVNCAALPESLLESELFGYEEGAFSGAAKGGKPGKFELANGGTFFLDEIGDMPLLMQVKLLRVLQEGVIERIGGVKPVFVDVRVIAATNQNLETMVKDGLFRDDLYYRLNVVPLSIAPLRERIADLKPITDFFLRFYNQKMKKNFTSFSDECVVCMENYPWPGNVREVQNAIEYALNMEKEEVISIESLPPVIQNHIVAPKRRLSLEEKVRQYERKLIYETLESFGNTLEGKKLAAKSLGISLPTLYRKSKDTLHSVSRSHG